ncbi:hypothetical protein Tco_1372265 [Tanacetum coccineum]
MFKRRLIAADQASVFMAMTSDHNRSELGIQDHSNEQSSSKLVPKVVPYRLESITFTSVINELTSGEIVSLNFIESIKEARSRVQDLTSGEIVSLNLLSRTKEVRSLLAMELGLY